MVRRLRLVLLSLVVVCFLLVGCFTVLGQTTEPKLISMGGSGWSLTVDKVPLTSDVKSVASVAAAKDLGNAQELSLVLNSMDECKSGQVQFKVDTQGLTCYKQLPLTEQEIKDGAVRPENVVNSYACFDSSGKKVLHIYASRLIDAKGNSVWVDQNLTKGVLTVYLNESWLSGAVFPVVLDPTFGYLNNGASTDSYTSRDIMCNFTLLEPATVVGLSWYGQTNVPSVTVWAAIWNDTGAYAPDKVLCYNYLRVANSLQWWNFSLSYSGYLSAGTYWLDVKGDTQTLNYYYDSVGTQRTRIGSSYYGYPTAPFSEYGSAARSMSIYGNYTVYAAPSASPTPTATPTVSSVLDMNWLVFAFVVFGAVLCIIPARIFVVRVVVGMFGIVLAVTQLQNTALWFYPWSLVLWLFMSVCVLYSVWARTD